MERNVQIAYVALKRLRVISFSAAENAVQVSVAFNDGKDRELTWNAKITEPKAMAARMLSELLAVVEGEQAEFDGETLTNNAVVLLHEKAKTEAAVADFFQTVYSKAVRIKHSTKSEGYLSMVADIKRTEVSVWEAMA